MTPYRSLRLFSSPKEVLFSTPWKWNCLDPETRHFGSIDRSSSREKHYEKKKKKILQEELANGSEGRGGVDEKLSLSEGRDDVRFGSGRGDLGQPHVDRQPVVVQRRRLEYYTGRAHYHGQGEDPQEQTIQHHRHEFPILLHLESLIFFLVKIRLKFKSTGSHFFSKLEFNLLLITFSGILEEGRKKI